jgi:acetyl esterase/lipase
VTEYIKSHPFPFSNDIVQTRKNVNKFLGEDLFLAEIQENTTVRERVVFDQQNNISGVWTRTKYSSDDCVIYYVHGGGFALLNPDIYAGSMEGISIFTNCSVFAVDQRLSPENPFPIGLSDIFNGYKYLITEANISTSKMIVMGESAGGNQQLALLLLLRDACVPLPAGSVSFSPYVSILTNYPSFYENQFNDAILYGANGDSLTDIFKNFYAYLPPGVYETLKYNPLVSPIFGDFKGITPIQFWVAKKELARDIVVAMFEKCLEGGVHAELHIGDHGIHAWNLLYYLNATKVDFVEVKRFISQVIK